MIITLLLNKQGFFSIFFFVLNHYLYCKKNKKNYAINTDNWLFKSKNGWTDYFDTIELFYEIDNSTEIKYYDQMNTILDDFSLHEYRNAIKETYLYNKETFDKIVEIKKNFNLFELNYSSIFIRRGDKLIDESNYYNASKYVDMLLTKDPECKRIFIQTDDYNSVLEAKEYLENKNLDIEIITICNENNKGMIIRSHYKNFLNDEQISKNKDYLLKVKDNLTNFKPLDEMNADEIYEHTIQMIIGIDIVLNSNICVTDYESNVSRFIKLAHKNPYNVFDINNSNTDLNKILFPAYTFL
jgi:hypothetical protein